MASPNVIWQIVNRNNSYHQRRNGRTRRSGALCLSGERGNVKNVNSMKYSGLANKAVFGLDEDQKTITLYVKKSPEAAKTPRTEFEEIVLTGSFAASAKIIKEKTSSSYSRRDIEKAILARLAKTKRAQSVQMGGASKGAQKLGRGVTAEDDEE